MNKMTILRSKMNLLIKIINKY